MSNEDLDVTFVYGTNRVVYRAGGHFSGSSYTSPGYTTPTGSLCGYDLNFPEDEPMMGDSHITLDWPVRDDTNQREQLIYWMCDQYGLPNCYRRYVNLYVNGVKRGTIYDDVQQPGSDMLKEWYPQDDRGNLYKTDCWNEFDDTGNRIDPCILNSLEIFTSGGVKKTARYRWNWRPRAAGGSANDFSDLFALVDAVNVTGAGYQSTVENLVDMPNWMRTFALDDLASFWDAFGNPNAKNTFLYKPQYDGWKLMSWDFDVGLGVFNDPTDSALFPAGIDPTVTRMYNTPVFVRLYWQAIEEAVNGFFQTGSGTAINTILDSKYAAFQANGISLASPDAIKTWINQRRQFLITQLNGVSANFTVTGATNFSTNRNLVTLAGTAPVRLDKILVNGVFYPVTWTSVTAWRLSIPVSAGANLLHLQAVDRWGRPIAGMTRDITVQYTGENPAPEDWLAINEIMYHPQISGAAYVEIYNFSTNYSFDLSGWRVNGIDYTFPAGTIITNGQFLVIANDRRAFAEAYGGGVPVVGEFSGRLDNVGETLSLIKPGATPEADQVVDRVTYDSAPPWPAAADGQGASLQLLDPARDHNRVGNWSDGGGWHFYSFTGNVATSTRLSFYFETAGGDIYLDDISLVLGTVPAAGENCIVNGDFESTLAPWITGSLATNSAVAEGVAHSGSNSLHLVVTNGSQLLTTFYEDLASLQTNTIYTVSFWWLPGTKGTNLTFRMNLNYRGTIDTRVIRCTPGAANNVRTPLPEFPPLWLNEIMPDNRAGLRDNAGEIEPWIELCHTGSQALSLEDVFLSDSLTNLTQWRFPAGSAVGPGQFLVLWGDGQPEQSAQAALHTNFRLNPTNGWVVLSRMVNGAPQILDYVNYAGLEADRSYGSYPDGQLSYRHIFYYPTPGVTNNPAIPPALVRINEWMAANASTLVDPADSDFDDWFELYNAGNQWVDLTGYTLTDTLASPRKFEIPAGVIIPPGGFLVVWADEETGQTRTNGDLHVNFKLSQTGEVIALYEPAPASRLVDQVTFGAQTNNISQGRYPDGQMTPYEFMTRPTPGRPNRLNAAALQLVTIAFQTASGVTLRWQADPGGVYRVEFKDDLGEAAWSALPGDVVAEADWAEKSDLPAGSPRQRFYRVRQVR